MEYKEDEEYNFVQTQLIGNTQSWPWFGIPSGVYLVNPGMSIWVFTVLAKLFGIHHPTHLATAVQIFAWLGIALIIPFALRWVKDQTERNLWLWACTLAMVNPFLVLYQRKLWPEPFLPMFVMLTWMGWWNRHRVWGALLWGLVGASLGQIHMSGFFFALALFLWTLQWKRKHTQWLAWVAGSTLGALPLIPWAIYILHHPVNHAITAGWSEIVQLKFWAFFLTDPTGFHLGNPLGILRGPSHWDQLSDFVRYPLIRGSATYITGLAHLGTLILMVWIFARGLRSLWRNRRHFRDYLVGGNSNTLFVQNATFILCGVLMTATGVMIRRFYMAITFPLEFILLVRMARPQTPRGRNLLLALWIMELAVSANFVGYVHTNHGSITGDYGVGYQAQGRETPH